jgi:ComF family protein
MIITPLIDFFLPRLCFSCSRKLEPYEDSVCMVCKNQFKRADSKRIEYEYNKKFLQKKYISAFTSLYVFERDKEIQHLIHSLKYNKRFKAGLFLGREAGLNLKHISDWNIDLIIPVPLHRLKQIQRGYNQSYYIALGLSRVTDIDLNRKAIRRKKNTLSQTKMNLLEREDNIKEAFILNNRKLMKDKNILLVDDVITTGSTLNECARILKEGGAREVYALSAAIADLESVRL